MEGLNWKELEQIPIPEGLEERLSAKIDEWEESEKRKVKSESSAPIRHFLLILPTTI